MRRYFAAGAVNHMMNFNESLVMITIVMMNPDVWILEDPKAQFRLGTLNDKGGS